MHDKTISKMIAYIAVLAIRSNEYSNDLDFLISNHLDADICTIATAFEDACGVHILPLKNAHSGRWSCVEYDGNKISLEEAISYASV